MLRFGWWFFVVVALAEVVFIALGKLDFNSGWGPICIAVFFAAILRGMDMMYGELKAVRAELEQMRRATAEQAVMPS